MSCSLRNLRPQTLVAKLNSSCLGRSAGARAVTIRAGSRPLHAVAAQQQLRAAAAGAEPAPSRSNNNARRRGESLINSVIAMPREIQERWGLSLANGLTHKMDRTSRSEVALHVTRYIISCTVLYRTSCHGVWHSTLSTNNPSFNQNPISNDSYTRAYNQATVRASHISQYLPRLRYQLTHRPTFNNRPFVRMDLSSRLNSVRKTQPLDQRSNTGRFSSKRSPRPTPTPSSFCPGDPCCPLTMERVFTTKEEIETAGIQGVIRRSRSDPNL